VGGQPPSPQSPVVSRIQTSHVWTSIQFDENNTCGIKKAGNKTGKKKFEIPLLDWENFFYQLPVLNWVRREAKKSFAVDCEVFYSHIQNGTIWGQCLLKNLTVTWWPDPRIYCRPNKECQEWIEFIERRPLQQIIKNQVKTNLIFLSTKAIHLLWEILTWKYFFDHNFVIQSSVLTNFVFLSWFLFTERNMRMRRTHLQTKMSLKVLKMDATKSTATQSF